eukprot:1158767-Pelagomonas_calceolata.AAC.6
MEGQKCGLQAGIGTSSIMGPAWPSSGETLASLLVREPFLNAHSLFRLAWTFLLFRVKSRDSLAFWRKGLL